MSEFEKWVNSLNLNEEKKLMPIAKMGWLAALKWALDNAVYIHSSDVAIKIIEQEIAAIEQEIKK